MGQSLLLPALPLGCLGAHLESTSAVALDAFPFFAAAFRIVLPSPVPFTCREMAGHQNNLV